MYNIGRSPFQDSKWYAGIGYVTYPLGVDRDSFITASILEGSITIKTEDGGYYHHCPVSKNIFNEIKWPEKPTENGTPVFFVTEPIDNQPVILGAFNFTDEVVDLQENSFKISKEAENRFVQITGSVNSISELVFLVKGVDKSRYIVNILNDANEGEVEFDVDGSFSVRTTEDIELNSQKEIVFNVQDSSVSQTTSNYQINCENVLINSSKHQVDSDETLINAEKFSINSGDEPLVLGNKLKSFLESMIDEIARSTVATPTGPSPLINSAQIVLLKRKLNQILSTTSFTD